jgi:hypothetical protein
MSILIQIILGAVVTICGVVAAYYTTKVLDAFEAR